MPRPTTPGPPSRPSPPDTARVAVILDGGGSVGYGHAGRCLALAEELGAGGGFVAEDPELASFLAGHGARLLDEAAAPVVVLDRARPTSAEEVEALQAAGSRVCLLDDLGDGRDRADAVVDPPTAAAWPPAAGRRMAGFEHALLRRAIRDAKPGGSGHVLLGIGGSDPRGLTPALAEALAPLGPELLVAMGPGYRAPAPAHGSPLPDPDAWAGALAGAALVVCGYGHSLLEAAYWGVPAVAVVFVDDHEPHARAFAGHGTAEIVPWRDGGAGAAAGVAGGLLASPARLAEMSRRARALVDGRGAERVARALLELA